MSNEKLIVKNNERTVGDFSRELALKDSGTHTTIEQMRENLTEWDKNIYECVETHKKVFDTDFYITVITKRERLMPNVFRNYFFARLTCPTPDYDQTVFKYTLKNDQIEFIWVIPSKHTCLYLLDNQYSIDSSQHDLLQFVLNFKDGTLFKTAQKLNKERSINEVIENIAKKEQYG